jgi:hypothetical protein
VGDHDLENGCVDRWDTHVVSDQNVEIVRRLNEEFNRDGWNALWRIADPDLESCEPPEQPGSGVFRGLECAREGVERSWQANWVEQRSVAEEIVGLDEHRVLLVPFSICAGATGLSSPSPRETSSRCVTARSSASRPIGTGRPRFTPPA